MTEPEKERHSFRERMAEADELIRKGREERAIEQQIQEIHEMPSVEQLVEELRDRSTDVEGQLREQMNLPRNGVSTGQSGTITLEDRIRKRLGLERPGSSE